jgi:hypothetical protein
MPTADDIIHFPYVEENGPIRYVGPLFCVDNAYCGIVAQHPCFSFGHVFSTEIYLSSVWIIQLQGNTEERRGLHFGSSSYRLRGNSSIDNSKTVMKEEM